MRQLRTAYNRLLNVNGENGMIILYLVTGMYKICQIVTHHFLWAQSTNALNVLAGKDQLLIGPNHKAEAIEAGQEVEIVGAVRCFAPR